MLCPYCQTENRDDRETCYHCEKSISMLRVIVNKARHHYNMALEHAERGRIDQAISELQNCIDLDRSFTPAHVVLGTLLARKGEFESAREAWQNALALQPELEKAHGYIGRADQVEKSLPLLRAFQIVLAVALATIVVLVGMFIYLERPDPVYEGIRRAEDAYVEKQYGKTMSILNEILRAKEGNKSTLANAALLKAALESEMRQQIDFIQQLKFSEDYPEALKLISDLRENNPDDATSAAASVILKDIQFFYKQQIEEKYQQYLNQTITYAEAIETLEEFLNNTPDLPGREEFQGYIARVRAAEAERQLNDAQDRFMADHDVQTAISELQRVSAEFPGSAILPEKRIQIIDAVLSWMFDHFQELIDSNNFAAARGHLAEISSLARDFSDIVPLQGPVDAAINLLDDMERSARLEVAENLASDGDPAVAHEALLLLAVDDTLTTAEMLVVDGMIERLDRREKTTLVDKLKGMEKNHFDLSLSDTEASETLDQFEGWKADLSASDTATSVSALPLALATAAAVRLNNNDLATSLSERLNKAPGGKTYRETTAKLLKNLKKPEKKSEESEKNDSSKTRSAIVTKVEPTEKPRSTSSRRQR